MRTIALMMTFVLAGAAHAQLFKCVTPSGGVEYRDAPCADERHARPIGGSVNDVQALSPAEMGRAQALSEAQRRGLNAPPVIPPSAYKVAPRGLDPQQVQAEAQRAAARRAAAAAAATAATQQQQSAPPVWDELRNCAFGICGSSSGEQYRRDPTDSSRVRRDSDNARCKVLPGGRLDCF